MTNERIHYLVNQLTDELQTENLNKETVDRLLQFEGELEQYINKPISGNQNISLIDQAKRLEIDFAQKHPLAEGVLQELISTLSKMGV